jgi:hydroxypyruvate isomerase
VNVLNHTTNWFLFYFGLILQILFTQKVGNEYNYIAQYLVSHIIKDLERMNDEIDHMIKYSSGVEKSLSKSYESALNDCKRLKTDDIKAKTVVDGQYEDYLKKNSLDFKTWIKLSNQVKKTEIDYKISTINQNKTHENYFNGLKSIMNSIEQIDFRKTKLIKICLLKYKILMDDLSKVIKERNKIMGEAFLAMNPQRETKEFVLSLKTGLEKNKLKNKKENKEMRN